ncbi:MAG: S1C family serine protease [Christensenellaceae bacterium]|jgi:S1-C subfamily serine protease|nr:S1C family serine protease [Christensenellaceae bacterium]
MYDDQKYDQHYERKNNAKECVNAGHSRVKAIYVLAVLALCFLSGYIAWICATNATRRDENTSKIVNIIVDPTIGVQNLNQIPDESLTKAYKSIVNVMSSSASMSSQSKEGTRQWRGVVWASDQETGSYILTDDEVTSCSEGVLIETSDGNILHGSVALYDEVIGLALVTTSAKLQPVTVSAFENIVPGNNVFSFGRSGIAYNGIISVGGKVISIGDETMYVIQSNVCVENDDFAGGLFDSLGNFIGFVNVADYDRGISYAIPGDVIYTTLTELMTKGYVSGRVDEDMFKFNEVSIPNILQQRIGLRITSININGDTTLSTGDYVIAVNGRQIFTKKEWVNELRKYAVNDKIVVTFVRGGVVRECYITLQEKQEDDSDE